MEQIWNFLQRPYFYIIIIAIGLAFKIAQIEQAFFWGDEMATIFHTNGQDATNFFDKTNNEIIRPSTYYTDLIRLGKRSDTNLAGQLSRMVVKPQFTPLHYPYLVIWYRIMGDAPMAYRWFSFFCFILVLISLFFLAKTLFQSQTAAWIAVSIMAVSPFFHDIALPARYYSLFTLSCIVVHLSLLYALQTNKKLWWGIYALALIQALYVSFFTIFIMLAHTLFIIWKKRDYWKPYFISSTVATLGYVPWLWLLWQNYEEMYQAMEWHKLFALSFIEMVSYQLRSFSLIILELGGGPLIPEIQNFSPFVFLIVLFKIAAVVLAIWSIVYLLKKGGNNTIGLIIPSILIGSLFLFWSDIFRKTFLSLLSHYHIFMILGIFLAIVHLLSKKISLKKAGYLVIFILAITLSIVSLAFRQGKRCIMSRGDCPGNIEMARLFEEPGRHLLVTNLFVNYSGENVVAILNESNAQNLDILTISDESDLQELIPANTYDHIYLFEIGEKKEEILKEKYGDQMSVVSEEPRAILWELKLD